MKFFLISVLLLVTMNTLYADCHSGKWCSNVKIKSLRVMNNGNILVETNGNEGQLRCDAPNGKYTTIVSEDAGSNAMFSALLTAKTTNSLVTVRIDTNSDICRIIYVY